MLRGKVLLNRQKVDMRIRLGAFLSTWRLLPPSSVSKIWRGRLTCSWAKTYGTFRPFSSSGTSRIKPLHLSPQETDQERGDHDKSLASQPPSIDNVDDDIAACWAADSWTANPDGNTSIDYILQGLHSPAPQSFFVIERALRCFRKGNQSPRPILEDCQYLVKDQFRFCFFNQDVNLSWHRPGIDWSVSRVDETPREGWEVVPRDYSICYSASQIASDVLDLVADASEMQETVEEAAVRHLLRHLESRLELTLGTDIRGRTAADTAFALCLAGVSDESLFERLAYIAKLEMMRVGKRSSRRARDVLHVVEKLAAAGLRGKTVQDVYNLAAQTVPLSDAKYDNLRTILMDSQAKLNLLSTRPLLWLWRFSARQSKMKVRRHDEINEAASLKSSSCETLEWMSGFKDSSLPLVVDIGCGLGVSLVGLASLRQSLLDNKQCDAETMGIDWNECNYLGGDLSILGTRFGKGIATRWELTDHLQFTLASAQDLIQQVDRAYPGRVALIMIQFPSPYRLKESGNTQLPSEAKSGFMVNDSLMGGVAQMVRRSGGHVLLQSNCEDIAVAMKDLGTKMGLSAVPAAQPVLSVDDMPPHGRTPQRQQEWIRLGGKRALGPEWSRVPLLPQGCATETEASCEVEKTPVHRCLMKA